MYKITVDGAAVGYSDTAVYVRLAEYGCYVPCEEGYAEGVCVKLPTEHTDEDGVTVKTADDIVFALSDGALIGTEQVAELEEVSGSLMLGEAEAVVNILTGGNE